MGAIEIIKSISEVGFPIVAAGLLLYLAYRMFTKQQNWIEEFMHDKLPPPHPSSEVVNALDVINNKIYEELQNLRCTLEADRAYLFLYHNGGRSSSGLYFQKMSCICEVVNLGILPLSNEKQNLYRASYSSLCDKLNTQGYYNVPEVAELSSAYTTNDNRDEFLYQILKARHADAAYFSALRITTGDVVGFIGIDYCSRNHNIREATIIKEMKTASTKAAALVDIRDEM